MNVQDISELKEIYHSDNSIVWTGIDTRTGKKVAVKMLNNEFPSHGMIARFNEEAELSQRFDIKGVRKIIEKRKINNRHALVMEYVEGASLQDVIKHHTIDVKRFLHLAISASNIISEIHKNGIIHKDVNPRNLLVSTDESIYVIDFGIASLYKKETQKLDAPERLEGTLAYISPEQTGRMNHSVDSRSDLYSLGITFYEMITGNLPFDTTNAMELVHSHIAKVPDSPSARKAHIPEIISKIILKLISKNIHDRYQTALSLKHDLEYCLEILSKQGMAALKELDFDLGRHGYNINFQIPENLYGREDERLLLLDAFHTTEAGGLACLLVGGHSGIGKTALVRELFRPVTEKRSYFLSGKFDQFQRDVPYSAIITAINGFVNQLLGESDRRLGHWKREIMEALGENAGVLTEVVPSLELIIGKQPEPADLPPVETQNRFNRVFLKFFKDLATFKHSLVIFIDDWQWADASSLQLFKNLLTDKETKHLLFLAAFRTNEVDATHPFMGCVDEMRKAEAPLADITLGELDTAHIVEMLKDAFVASEERVLPLAKLIKAKTSGNPFFVSQFLQNLYDGGHIAYNYEKQAWDWNVEHITGLPISTNVLDLMTARIKTLQPKTQELLQLAACIGANFPLKLLSELVGKTQQDTRHDILEALEQGFLLPAQGNHYAVDEEETDKGIYFQFLHDRVQQAAYLMGDEARREQVSLQIGRSVYQNNNDAYKQQWICDIANYYNKGSKLITEETEKHLLAEINLKATIKAKKVTAYNTALVYAKAGIAILGEAGWDTHFDLYYELHKQLADALYLSGGKEEAEDIFEVLIEKAPNRLEKLRIYGMKGMLYESSARYAEAIVIARQSLALLDIVLPEDENEKQALFGQEIGEVLPILTDETKGVAYLKQLPQMQDEELIEAIKTMYLTWGACYMANDMNNVLLLSAKMINIAIKHGNIPETAWAYASLIPFVSSGLGNYQLGYELGQTAIELNEQYNDIKTKGTIHHLMGTFGHFWRKPSIEGLHYFDIAYEACVNSGNYPWAGYAHGVSVRQMLLAGFPLLGVEETTDKNIQKQYAINNIGIAQLLIVVTNALVKNMLGKTESVYSFSHEGFNEETHLKTFGGLPISIAVYEPLKSRMYLYHNEYKEAVTHSINTIPVISALFGADWTYFQNINYSLALCGLVREHGNEKATKIVNELIDACNEKAGSEVVGKITSALEQIQTNQTQMKVWMDNCEENFKHHYFTVEAELANIQGDFMRAMELYTEAMRSANKHQFLHDEALAYELAGNFLLTYQGKDIMCEKEDFAAVYIRKALYTYTLWGAVTKVDQLKAKYKNFFASGQKSTRTTNTLSIGATIKHDSLHTSSYGDNALDLLSVMKASQTISQDIKLEALLRNMAMVLMENAGAERTLFIQDVEGQMRIAVEADIDKKEIDVLNPTPLSNDDRERVALSIIRQVYRTHETIVCQNAKKDNRFSMDFYIQHNDVKSLLCFPIMHQGKVRMVIYMEHNTVEGAFTSDRIEVLNMLSSQVAISIENSVLYETMEQKVAQRTAELAKVNEELVHKNTNITSSIKYALRMQQAILPTEEEMKLVSHDYFALYLPKDIVSGDFYWYAKIHNRQVVAAIDCTGHGVPGAFMSMIANTLLDEIVNQKEVTEPASILEQLHKGVRIALNQDVSNNNDGMDMCLCTLEKMSDGQTRMLFAGAKNSLYYVKGGEYNIIEADRRSIGGQDSKNPLPFQTHTLMLNKDDVFYLSTDGYIDQAGGAKRMAFSRKRLIETIKEHWQKSMPEQREVFQKALAEHQGNIPQRDDITLIGFRIA